MFQSLGVTSLFYKLIKSPIREFREFHKSVHVPLPNKSRL